QVDQRARVLDGTPVEAVAQQAFVVPVGRGLAALGHLPDDRAGRRVAAGREVDLEHGRRVDGVWLRALLVQVVEHLERVVGATRPAGRDRDVPTGAGGRLDAGRTHRVEDLAGAGEVACVEV